MNLTKFMDTYYDGLPLTADLFHSLHLTIHVELGEDIYQLQDNGKLNMQRFHSVYTDIAAIFSLLFHKDDDVLVVANCYPIDTKKTAYPNIFRRYVKTQQTKYSLHVHDFIWTWDEDIRVQQMEWLGNLCELKWAPLVKTLAHKDFKPLKPQLRKKNNVLAPTIFLINLRTNCIFHIYDDRGCEIMNTRKDVHEQILTSLQQTPFNWYTKSPLQH